MQLFNSIEEVLEEFDESELVYISNIKQIITYCKCGVQPIFVQESENKPDNLCCVYLRKLSRKAYEIWQKEKNNK